MVSERYGWPTIAANTADVYATAIAEAPGFAAKQAAAILEHGRPQIVVPDGNLLTL
jgi:glycogen(starch) synthase